MKIILNAQQLAAYAAGASFASLGFKPGDEVELSAGDVVVVKAEVAPPAPAPSPAPAPTPAPTPAPAPAAGTLEAVTAELAGFKAQVVTLTAQAKTSETSLAQAKSDLTVAQADAITTKAQLTAAQASSTALLEIARGATSKMSVALGGSADSCVAMDSAQVVAEHTRLSEVFNKKFRIGGVAAPSADLNKPADTAANPPPAYLAIIASGPQGRHAKK